MGLKRRTTVKPAATNGEVETWFAAKSHPQEALMREVRKVILGADERVTECVKWSSPTFLFEGNIVNIDPMAKKFVSLMFHTGGKIPTKLPQLTGAGATCKYLRFDDVADVK